MTMTQVNGDISDLFFNHDVSDAVTTDATGAFDGYDVEKLREIASNFIGYLERLGVDSPTPDALVQNFINRV